MSTAENQDYEKSSYQDTLNEGPTDVSSTNLDTTNAPTTTKEAADPEPPAPFFDQSNVLPFRQLMIVYAGLALAMFLAALDQLIVSTAAPKIVAEFDGLTLIAWIFNAYQLSSTSLMPVYGRFSDVFGRKVVILFAIIAFEIGSLLAGISQSMTQLIIFRAVQGIGAGGIQSMVFVIIADIVPLSDRGKYQGIIGAVWGLSGVLGPLVGGAFADHVTWRWCFFINIPIGVVSVIFIVFFLKLKTVPGDIRTKLARIDWWGTLAIVIAITLVLLPTIWGGSTYAWSSAIEIALYCIAGVATGVFIYIEGYIAKEPIVPFHLFKNISVTAAFTGNFFFGANFFGLLSYMSIYFQVVRGDSATTSGIELIPWMLALVITGAVSGILTSVTGRYRPFIWVCGCLITVGSGLCYMWDANTSKGQIVGELIFQGFSLGLGMQTIVLALQASVEYKDIAIATALVTFFRFMGSVIGSAICSALFNNKLLSSLESLNLSPEMFGLASSDPLFVYSLPAGAVRDGITNSYIDAIRLTFMVCIPFGGLCLFCTAFIKHYSLKKSLGPVVE